MKWTLYVNNKDGSQSIVHREYPKTTKADQGAVSRLYAHEKKISADRVLAMPCKS